MVVEAEEDGCRACERGPSAKGTTLFHSKEVLRILRADAVRRTSSSFPLRCGQLLEARTHPEDLATLGQRLTRILAVDWARSCAALPRF